MKLILLLSILAACYLGASALEYAHEYSDEQNKLKPYEEFQE